MDQILKQPAEVKIRDTAVDEAKFKKNMAEYKIRAAQHAKKLLDEVCIVALMLPFRVCMIVCCCYVCCGAIFVYE